ncbi:pterin-4-alpha-carbinolamine dehydratase [Stylonychia lemnae]|uniref:4a-hydroxytetrahydrobiopterin dehydratase n=1 Tax=Stylonychia lemnae TaxID=5949 RepID=A0A078AQC4_STYLE|nr:pterin-4-alpha-carbinolamine dehydratase [Stylonychia lemnae]|eukprot:CDW84364.1 pterin-4-alpha-carbinolamine dehydratase [Stylonychia lemnae]
MFTSVIQRRLVKQLLAKNPASFVQASRNFSALLVPITPHLSLPADVFNSPLTEQHYAQLQKEFEQFNLQCAEELKEMNQNRITNIIERGGVEGWDTAEDLAYLRKSFEFHTFEQAQAFVQRVGRFANQKDHHPEWSTSQGGRVVTANLTSHFAGNKVTLFDFQLAEQMNKDYKITHRMFRQYPLLSSRQWSTIQIGFTTYVILGFVLFIGMTMYIPAINERSEENQVNHHTLVLGQFDMSEALKLKNDEELAAFVEKNTDDFTLKNATFKPLGYF